MGTFLRKCLSRTVNNELIRAARDCNHKYTTILINGGASVNIKDFDGETAIFQAADRGCGMCLDTLVKAGADANKVKSSGLPH